MWSSNIILGSQVHGDVTLELDTTALIPALIHLLELQFPQAQKRMGSPFPVCRQQQGEGIEHCGDLSKNGGLHKLIGLHA